MQKNALSVQSLACHGKCSLTEALPLISAKGISLSVLPTVLLSTHTGGFGNPESLDTTEFLVKSIEHFKAQNIRFDGIYTGYFGSSKQINSFKNQISNLKKAESLILVDPVLGDRGRLFSGITEDYVTEMLSLCKQADIITPNVTEAFLLCSESYCKSPAKSDIVSLAVKLYNLTKTKVIITGIENNTNIGVLIFDGAKCDFIYTKKADAHFHGTGDMFAALLFGYILNGLSIKKSVKKTMCFITKAIKNTAANERDGIEFETLI